MNKISVFVIGLLATALVSCGDSTKEVKEAVEVTTEDRQVSEAPNGTDFLKNYETFINQEIAKLEQSPNAETIAESKKATEAFVAKYGDPNAIDMTAEAQTKLTELRNKYNSVLEKANDIIHQDIQ